MEGMVWKYGDMSLLGVSVEQVHHDTCRRGTMQDEKMDSIDDHSSTASSKPMMTLPNH